MNNLFKKITAIGLSLASIFTMLSSTLSVSAVVNDTETVGASWNSNGSRGSNGQGIYWDSNIDYYYDDNSGNAYNVTYSKGQGFRVHYFAKSGETLDFSKDSQRAFCIEPDKGVELTGSGEYTTSTDLSGIAQWNKLTDNQKKVLNYVLACGYGNYSSSKQYWYATQLLVYEVVAYRHSMVSFEPIDRDGHAAPQYGNGFLNPSTYLVAESGAETSVSAIQTAYNNMINWVKKCLNAPSYANLSSSSAPNYTMAQNSDGTYSITLHDDNLVVDMGHGSSTSSQNTVASDFKVDNSSVSVTLNKSSNTVTFKSSEPLDGKVKVTVTNSFVRGLQSFKKENLSIILSTDWGGYQAFARGCTFSNPVSYFYLNTPKDQGVMEIYKKSANEELTNNNSCYSLEGAKFQIFTDKDCKFPAKNSSDSNMYIITDKNGVGYYGGSTRNVTASLIESYYVKEIEAPKGFALNKEVFRFTKSSEVSENGYPIYTFTCMDVPQGDPIDILLRKVDENGNGLQNAEFTVYYYNNELTRDEVKADLAKDNPSYTRHWTFKSDENGYINFTTDKKYFISGDDFYYLDGKSEPIVPLGTLVISETKAPEDHIIDANNNLFVDYITGDNSGLSTVKSYNTHIIPNDSAMGKLSVIKQDGENKKKLSNAEFGVYSSNETDADGWLLDKYLVDKFTTDSNGVGTSNSLINNTYYVQERKSPIGYVHSKEIKEAVIKADAENSGEVILTLNFFDAPITVKVSKTDITGQNELPGAHLVVTGNKFKEEWISTTETHIIKNIPAGTYELTETISPDGYATSSSVMFTVKDDGSVTHAVMIDDTIKLELSKVDINGNLIAGTHMQLLDSNGEVVNYVDENGNTSKADWVTDGKNTFKLYGCLKANATYVLHEVKSADGYAYADDIEFTVADTADVQAVSMKDKYTDVVIEKVDTDGNYVSNAELQIIDPDNNNVVAEWNTSNGPYNITGKLTAGKTYILHEKKAPVGKVVAQDVEFIVPTVAKQLKVTMIDDDTKVSIIKVDEDGVPVENVVLQIINPDDNNVVAEWTTDGNLYEIIGELKAGKTYILHEVSAPDGMGISENKEFIVPEDGSAITVTMVNNYTHESIIKIDEEGNPLSGAVLQILDKDNKVIDEWTSSEEPHDVKGKLVHGETYILREVSVPDGYVISEDIKFIATSTDKENPDVITMIDKKTVTTFSKTDITGENELPDAHIVVKDEEGNIVDEWTSTDEKHIIKGLIVGKTYTMIETISPNGYVVANDVKFTVNENGITEVNMKDDTTKYRFIKTSEDGKALEGAVLQIVDEEGNEIAKWTTTDKPYELIGKLVVGKTYTLKELSAPDGYQKADDITFTVENTGDLQTITMVDKATGDVKISTPDTPIPQTNSQNGGSSTVQTGATTSVALIFGIALIALVAMLFFRKRKEL